MEQYTYYDENQNGQNNNAPDGSEPGKGAAIASLVLGILSIVGLFIQIPAFVTLIMGIVGIVLASNAKKLGCKSGMIKAGKVCSIIGVILGGLAVLAGLLALSFLATIFGSIFGIASSVGL